MKPDKQQLRIATYNVHKCRGMDRRTSPERIGRILQSLDADVIGLQEVLDARGGRPKLDQARYLLLIWLFQQDTICCVSVSRWAGKV